MLGVLFCALLAVRWVLWRAWRARVARVAAAPGAGRHRSRRPPSAMAGQRLAAGPRGDRLRRRGGLLVAAAAGRSRRAGGSDRRAFKFTLDHAGRASTRALPWRSCRCAASRADISTQKQETPWVPSRQRKPAGRRRPPANAATCTPPPKPCRASSWPRCSSNGCAPRWPTPTTNVPLQRTRLDAAGARPADIRSLDDLRAAAVHHQDRPARPLSVRPVRPAAQPAGAAARLVGHHRQADRRRLHARGHRQLGRPDGALAVLRPARAAATWCTTPTATACSPAAWARTTAPSAWAPWWCRCRAASTERQVALIMDFGARAVRHAVVRAGDRRGGRAAGRRPAQERAARSACSAPSPGARRCATRSRRASA